MKSEILKIAGVKSEKEFYKKYPTEAEFMKVHGKAFKKAQTGTAIKKAQNFGNLDANNNGILDAMENPGGFNASMVGQTANYADSGRNNKFPKPAPFTGFENPPSIPAETNPYGRFAPGNVNSWDIDNNGVPDTIQQVEGNPLMNNSSTQEKKKPFNVPGALNLIGGISNAFDAFRESENTTRNLEAWAGVSDVQKKAAISNAFVPEQPNEYYRADELKNIYAANERYNKVGRGTDVLNVGQNGSFIGGNPTEIQNMYSNEITLYDNLEYEPFHETEDDNVKAFQNGSGFGNILGAATNEYAPFLAGSVFGKGGLFGGDTSGNSLIAGMFGNNAGSQFGKLLPGPAGMIATAIGGYLDKNPGRQRNAQNKIDSNNRYIANISSGRGMTGSLSSMGVGQNGENLEVYEEGGYMNPEYNPQVITMFGDHTAADFADYAHKYRAGGHLKEYTAPSERAMETYAMGGKIQSHWGGSVEDVSYNPYMPGSGITSMIKGASHKDGGVGISYGNTSQNGYGYAANGANMEAQIEAEGGEPMIEMEEGGSVNPETGEMDTNAVVIGNIPMNQKMAEATGDPDLIEIARQNPNTSMKKIFEKYTEEEVKATKDLEKASMLANEAESQLDKTTAEAIATSAKKRLKMIAKKKIKMAKYQDTLHKIKEDVSKSRGKNISAEALGRGKIKDDLDPITKDAPIGNAKSGAYLRKAQSGQNIPKDAISIGYGTYAKKDADGSITYYYDDGNKEQYKGNDVIITDRNGNTKTVPSDIYTGGNPPIDIKIDRSGIGYVIKKKDMRDESTNTSVTNKTVPNTPTTTSQDPALTQEEYNELVKLYNEGASTSSGKSAAIKNFQRKYHQKFPKESLAAIQKTTKEKGLSNKAKQLGLTVDDILAGKDIQKILESNEDEFWGDRTRQYMASINSAYNKRAPLQLNTLGATASTTGQSTTAKPAIDVVPLKKNNAIDVFGMMGQLFQKRQFPPMDPRQLAGEYVALAQNTPRPVPMQKPYVELDPVYRMNYNDVRASNTAAFRDMLRQNQGNPAADAIAFSRFAQQNQTIGGEEFRANQAIEQQIYGGNRAKMNANLEKGLTLNANQANLRDIADSKGRELTQKAIASMADKNMKYAADKNRFLTASNLFPTYGYGPNYQTQVQGPGYRPYIPQIAGGESTIQKVPVYKDGKLDHYEMIEGDSTTTDTTTLAPYQTPPFVANVGVTKNGGKVKKNYKNSSVVRAYKNL